ncbi:MAG: MBL fold metallo-hydrolase [Bacteroidaceae bacterium]|nr:MBL fold metallo-hydrolase [Bacteroidaceae bacterium]
MKIKLLGTGTSTGVPELGCSCEVCTSSDARDKRLRCSALVQEGNTRLLIDCGPDFRTQMLGEPFERLSAVLLTHKHYDHIAGLDDLRPYCRQGDIPVYAERETELQVHRIFPYCFGMNRYPGVPNLQLRTVVAGEAFSVEGVDILPVRLFHGMMPIVGYRIGRLAYITDMSYIEPHELDKLKGVEVLVVNALRYSKPHRTHQTVLEALRIIEQVEPRVAYLTHLMHHIGLHAKIEKCLPDNVFLGYDGLEIDV